jgi:hypothetical protein
MKIKAIAKTELPPKQREELVGALKARIEKNLGRHPGLVWAKVHARLEAKPDNLWSLAEMERTGGEPDVVVLHPNRIQSLSRCQFAEQGAELCAKARN